MSLISIWPRSFERSRQDVYGLFLSGAIQRTKQSMPSGASRDHNRTHFQIPIRCPNPHGSESAAYLVHEIAVALAVEDGFAAGTGTN